MRDPPGKDGILITDQTDITQTTMPTMDQMGITQTAITPTDGTGIVGRTANHTNQIINLS
jgi:hypothetical protein